MYFSSMSINALDIRALITNTTKEKIILHEMQKSTISLSMPLELPTYFKRTIDNKNKITVKSGTNTFLVSLLIVLFSLLCPFIPDIYRFESLG